MTIFYDHPHTVSPEEIDDQAHVHNLRYLQWSLWAAGGHTRTLGHDVESELARGFGFVVREHNIVYRKAAFAGDDLVVRTWIANLDDHSSRRQAWICRPADRCVLAKVKTRWVYADLKEHHLAKIPDSVRSRVTVLERPPEMPWQQ